jgi:hypothetical protein
MRPSTLARKPGAGSCSCRGPDGGAAAALDAVAEAASRLAAVGPRVIAVRAPGLPDRLFQADALGIRIGGRASSVLATADLAFVASGTDAGSARRADGRRLSNLGGDFAIGRLRIRSWISLVNIVAGEQIVPELLQEEVTAERLEREGATVGSGTDWPLRARLDRVCGRSGPERPEGQRTPCWSDREQRAAGPQPHGLVDETLPASPLYFGRYADARLPSGDGDVSASTVAMLFLVGRSSTTRSTGSPKLSGYPSGFGARGAPARSTLTRPPARSRKRTRLRSLRGTAAPSSRSSSRTCSRS